MRRIIITCLLLTALSALSFGYDLKVWLSSPTMVADGKTVTYLTVYQTDAEELYWNFELHISLPKGISIAQREEGRNSVNDATLNEQRFGGLPHSLGVNMPDSSTLKSICVNMLSKATYYRDDADGNPVAELFRVGLIADPEMKDGKYDIEITKAMFVRTDVTGYTLEQPAKAVLTVTGGQSAEEELIYTLSETGYDTLILPYDAVTPDGLQAYACTGLNGTTVMMERLRYIPANTPVVLHGIPGTYSFSGISVATEPSYSNGLLTGVFDTTEITDGYVIKQQNDVVGFYATGPNTPSTVPANRCYLNIPSGVLFLQVEDADDADGVAHLPMSDSKDEETAFGLDGRRVQPNAKGIVIINGRKELK